MEWVIKEDQAVIYPYAGFFRRGVAFLFDGLVVKWLTGAVLALTALMIENSVVDYILSTLVFVTYFVLMTKFNHGQTLGKMLLGLQVIRKDREELTWEDVLLREACGRYLTRVVWILYAMPLVMGEKASLGDYFAKTRVVKVEAFKGIED
ncbi:RDD family protein [Atopobacter sp. AH10]|uniref:RDD family protein n=1 Tax=Atopobacter sp. AH10 TaxID=2315861 RepID=UPI001314BD10|nr:RDD family protein [Atopobacter sp. AH10]